MIETQIENLSNVQNQIERLEQGIGHFRANLMRQVAGTMHHAVLQNFRYSGRPKWAGLKYRKGKPLIDTGTLRGSISQHYDNDTALVATNLASTHSHPKVADCK